MSAVLGRLEQPIDLCLGQKFLPRSWLSVVSLAPVFLRLFTFCLSGIAR
jgi:hypothetical protein